MTRDSIEQIARALNEAGVPYLIVGGLAVIVHGYGRHTRDVDIVVRLRPDAIKGAFSALAGLGYRPLVPVTADQFADSAQRERWVAEKGMMVLNLQSDRYPRTPIDLFVKEPFDFQAEYDSAYVEEIAPGVPLRVLRVEALIRLKEQARRPQDLADIAELRKLHGGA